MTTKRTPKTAPQGSDTGHSKGIDLEPGVILEGLAPPPAVNAHDATQDQPASNLNPLIGQIPADTLNNCQLVLGVLQDSTEVNDSSDGTGMGRYLILESVRNALAWMEHHQLRSPAALRASVGGGA